jgi:hypothetical protein
MRKSVINLAVAAAALLGAASIAQAKVVLSLKAFASDGITQIGSTSFCDSSAFGACSASFSLVGGGLSFVGSVGNFSVTTTSFTGNLPGTPSSATLDASTTKVKNNSASGFGFFFIDVFATDYMFPAGNEKYLSGSASLTQTGSSVTAGDFVTSRFYADGTNAGLLTNQRSCTMNSATTGGCDAGTGAWTDADGGLFAMRDIQVYRLTAQKTINTTASGEVTPIPEPMTLSLVGAALLAAGFAARRKAKQA